MASVGFKFAIFPSLGILSGRRLILSLLLPQIEVEILLVVQSSLDHSNPHPYRKILYTHLHHILHRILHRIFSCPTPAMLGPWENGIGQDVRSDDAMAQRCQFNGLFTLNRTMGEEPGQLDVDLTILDYLLFKSTESMLNARIAELDETVMPNRESPEIKIEMTHAWLNFIHKHHGADALPPQTRFRAHLLQFTDRKSVV